MLQPTITAYLAGLALSPATAAGLQSLIDAEVERLADHPPIAAPFAVLPPALGGSEATVLRFRAAWTLMYAAIGRLDSLQDGDPIDAPPPRIDSVGAHYNLVFAAYILATSLLNNLVGLLPPDRLLRLHHLWARSLLHMADGQQQDLASMASPRSFDVLAAYQQLAQAKTGATYALAFGGLAIICSDDETVEAALTQVGELYGTLVQYADDLRDAADQPNGALTLPELLRFIPFAANVPPAKVPTAFWAYLRPIYVKAAGDALTQYPDLQRAVETLFTDVFLSPDTKGIA